MINRALSQAARSLRHAIMIRTPRATMVRVFYSLIATEFVGAMQYKMPVAIATIQALHSSIKI